jgi:hypothetical protein
VFELSKNERRTKMKKWIWLASILIVLSIVAGVYAATISRSWSAAVTDANTNAYGGATDDLAADQAYDYTSAIDMVTNGYDGAFITLEYDGSGTTDNIIVAVFGSVNGTTFDDIEIWQCSGSKTGNDEQLSFVIRDLPYFRIGVKTSGTTNTFDYRIVHRCWRWSSN